MRYTFSKLALLAFCGAVLATSSASAQFVALSLELEVNTGADMAVTQNGTTTSCSSRDMHSTTSHFTLYPEVGAFAQSNRGVWCGDVFVEIFQSMEVTHVYRGRNYILPVGASVRTVAVVRYPDGTEVQALDKTWSLSASSTPSPWTASAGYDPLDLPGVVFRNFADNLAGSYGG